MLLVGGFFLPVSSFSLVAARYASVFECETRLIGCILAHLGARQDFFNLLSLASAATCNFLFLLKVLWKRCKNVMNMQSSQLSNPNPVCLQRLFKTPKVIKIYYEIITFSENTGV